MTAEPSFAALRAYDQRLTGMLADPECAGELLLVGMGMARCIDLGEPPWDETGHMPMKVIAGWVYGNRWLPSSLLGVGVPSDVGDTHPRKRIVSVFYADRRRYRPDDTADYHWVTCGRPMVRRDGLCGRNATDKQRLVDPATGLRQWVGCCSNAKCKQWWADLQERNRRELDANPPPVPPANTGGVLERHLPEIDWWAVWRAVDPNWSPPPEGRAFERPKLRLLIADDTDDVEPVVAARPALVVHEGGWR